MKDKLMRFAQAYLTMAGEGYRPAAPSDGFGNIQLSDAQLKHPQLDAEAVKYAVTFERQGDALTFHHIGCSDFTTNRAFVFCIEAARLLCAGDADKLSVCLLELAIEEIKTETRNAT